MPCGHHGAGQASCLLGRIMMRQHLDIVPKKSQRVLMRTTLTIDDDLLAAAKALARDRSEPVGKVLSDLARRGLNATPRVRKGSPQSSFPVFSVPPQARPITLEDVRKGEDEW